MITRRQETYLYFVTFKWSLYNQALQKNKKSHQQYSSVAVAVAVAVVVVVLVVVISR